MLNGQKANVSGRKRKSNERKACVNGQKLMLKSRTACVSDRILVYILEKPGKVRPVLLRRVTIVAC